MKLKFFSLILTIAFTISLVPFTAIAENTGPFTLEAPQNLTAKLKYRNDGLPYFELKLDIPQSVKDIDQNLLEDEEYYTGIFCYPISVVFEYKFGDYDWNEGPSMYWTNDRPIYDFINDGLIYEYEPYADFNADEIDIQSEVYDFRAYFISEWGYIDDWVDKQVLSGYSNIVTVGNTAYYSGASNWAKTELDKAVEFGLITDSIKDKMNSPITREEFAELSVRLFELYTSTKSEPVSPNPFTDCINPEVLKAYKLGIINGVASDKFEPKALTNREQIAAMLNRAAKVMNPEIDFSSVGAPIFSDEKQISDWALENVRYMSKSGFVTGVGNNTFNPKATTTCEQAVVIAVRVYENFK